MKKTLFCVLIIVFFISACGQYPYDISGSEGVEFAADKADFDTETEHTGKYNPYESQQETAIFELTQSELDKESAILDATMDSDPNFNKTPIPTMCIPWESVIVKNLGEIMFVSGKVKSIFNDKSDYSDNNSYITLERNSALYQIITPGYDYPIGSEICLHGRIISAHGKLFLDVIDNTNYLNSNIVPSSEQPVPASRVMKIRIPTPDGGVYANPLEDPVMQKTLGYDGPTDNRDWNNQLGFNQTPTPDQNQNQNQTKCSIGGCTAHVPSCDIKGNITFDTKEKIYHVPGQKYYSLTVINPAYGERWFCTEAEAQENGWRKAEE